VQNTASADGFSEGLNASGGSLTGGATTGGSITNLSAGSSSSAISVGMSTATSGSKSGSVAIGLASNGSGTSGYGTTGLTGQTVNVTATVYDYATATFSQTTGDGSFSGAGTSYALDFGTGLIAGHSYTATINLANGAGSFRDDLGGSYGFSGSPEITNTSGSFSGLAAGNSNSFVITFLASGGGAYAGTLSFSGLSQQTGLSDASLAQIDISITAAVAAIPEPTTYAALAGGLMLAGALCKRRRNAVV